MNGIIDRATGLPVLPDGDFWRVKTFALTALQLERRRRRWFGRSTLIASEIVHPNSPEFGTVEEQLQKKAAKMTIIADVSHLVGDYPPNRLGVVSKGA